MTSLEKYDKYVIKLNFKDWHRFSKEFFFVEIGNTDIRINKPVYLEQAILDLRVVHNLGGIKIFCP